MTLTDVGKQIYVITNSVIITGRFQQLQLGLDDFMWSAINEDINSIERWSTLGKNIYLYIL